MPLKHQSWSKHCSPTNATLHDPYVSNFRELFISSMPFPRPITNSIISPSLTHCWSHCMTAIFGGVLSQTNIYTIILIILQFLSCHSLTSEGWLVAKLTCVKLVKQVVSWKQQSANDGNSDRHGCGHELVANKALKTKCKQNSFS